MIARLDALISEEADDKAALSTADHQRQAAQVQGDLLAIERDIAWLMWRGLDERLPIWFAADLNPAAILQCTLVTRPVVERRGSSPEHVGYNLVGGRRWQSCAATESPYHARNLRQRKVGTSTHLIFFRKRYDNVP
jgi:hypothetical protein